MLSTTPVIVHLSPELAVTLPEELLNLPFPRRRGQKEMRVRRPGFSFSILPNASCEVEINGKRILVRGPEMSISQVPVSEVHVDVSLVYNVYGLATTLAFLEYVSQSKRSFSEVWLITYLAGSLIVMTGKIEEVLFSTPIDRLIALLSSELCKRDAYRDMKQVQIPSIHELYSSESGVWGHTTATALLSDGSVVLWCGSHTTGTQQLVSEIRDDACYVELLSGESLRDGDVVQILACSLQRYADYFRVRGAHLPTAMRAVLDDLSQRIGQLNIAGSAAWLIQLRHDIGELSGLVLRTREEIEMMLRMAIELSWSLGPWTATATSV